MKGNLGNRLEKKELSREKVELVDGSLCDLVGYEVDLFLVAFCPHFKFCFFVTLTSVSGNKSFYGNYYLAIIE